VAQSLRAPVGNESGDSEDETGRDRFVSIERSMRADLLERREAQGRIHGYTEDELPYRRPETAPTVCAGIA
jgi:hypothetical protein